MDWKDSLSALRDSLPEGEQTDTVSHESAADGNESTTGSDASKHPRLDIILDRKGRKGKEATIIAGFNADDDTIAAIASQLKQKLGTGGSSRGGEILIQGDKRPQVQQALAQLGYKSRII